MLKGLLAAVAFVTLFGLTLFGYAHSGQTRVLERSARANDGVNVNLDLVAIDPERHVITLRATLFPEGRYLDSGNNTFAVPLRVTSLAPKDSVIYDIDAGQAVGGSLDLDLPIVGNPQNYPLDHYSYSYTDTQAADLVRAAPVLRIEEVGDDGKGIPVKVGPGPDEPAGLVGWAEQWRLVADGAKLRVDLSLQRSGAVIGAVAVVVFLVLSMAALAAAVAWAVATRRRPIEATHASWFAALLFALIPLQRLLPGAPEIGAWIDVCVFLWVAIVLMASMGVFMISWLRYRGRPDYAPERPGSSA
ncbi:hypothetical protein MANY_03720 [Mycolicibacterium anyangense]|uniref:DUF4436 domain-containing protein n=1 Tax=Mycolicibacterium anyangense TaxID=1431246 RepID=A0A6N4W2X8_9MYCO|nr:DUF4436 family protein [Mycolicibacterium anyangense]BBZ75035.1 hypothetical protein MANY_03720 [Mycolicibacterium anyangense]